MKYLVFVFVPLLRRTKQKPTTWGFYTKLLLATTVISIGLTIGLYKGSDQAARWEQHVGVITKVGTKPAHPNSYTLREYVLSEVDVSLNGEPDIRKTDTFWYDKEGDQIDFWSKGDSVIFDKPIGLYRLIVAEFLAWGILAAILAYLFLLYLEGKVFELDQQREQEKDLKRAAPSSLEEFVALCRENHNVTITWNQARQYGACEGGLRDFQKAYFPGRRKLAIDDLIPLIEGYHPFWNHVVRIVSERLIELKVLRSSYTPHKHVRVPEVDYKAKPK